MENFDAFISDIHAYPEAVQYTLGRLNLARYRGGEFELQDNCLNELVLLGDYLDRGPKNYETLELVEAILNHFGRKATALLGNHDVACIQALAHPEWFAEWMEGVPLLIQTATRAKLSPLSRPMKDAHPLANIPLRMDDSHTQKYFVEWNKKIEEKPEWQTINFPEAFGRTQDTFLSPRMRLLFQRMKIAHRVDDILAVHATMNEEGAMLGVGTLNQLYGQAIANLDIGMFMDYDWKQRKGMPHAPLSELLCMFRQLPSKDYPQGLPLLTEQTVRLLRQQGFAAQIHGHAAIGAYCPRPGVQELHLDYGFPAINTDIVTTPGHEAYSGSYWGGVVHERSSGQITAYNPKTPPLDFGRVIDGEYTPPRT